MKSYLYPVIVAVVTSCLLFSLSFSPSVHGVSGVASGAASARGADQPAELFGMSGMFSKITNILLFVIGAISVIMVIIGGLRYVLSGGDSSNIQAAKNTILYAIVGIVVALLAYAAVNFIIGSFAVGAGGGSGGATNF